MHIKINVKCLGDTFFESDQETVFLGMKSVVCSVLYSPKTDCDHAKYPFDISKFWVSLNKDKTQT